MLTLTLSFKNTEHQVVLAFDSKEKLDAVCRSLNDDGDQEFTAATDDYGTTATWRTTNYVFGVRSDVERYWAYRNKVSIIKLRAENDFNQELQADPTLKFLIGGAGPNFGSK